MTYVFDVSGRYADKGSGTIRMPIESDDARSAWDLLIPASSAKGFEQITRAELIGVLVDDVIYSANKRRRRVIQQRLNDPAEAVDPARMV
ncbi:MAG: hypothetical protein LBH66_09005 [Oscillospiraceae bacterium]|jgi:hypothetical protein|nr:hypothetical protein [Oscillospiraceae bacterium]